MDLQTQVFEVLEATGLNWTVNKFPLHSERDGQKLPTNSYGLFKNDTNKWLGTVGKQYVPYQNSQLAETILEASRGVKELINPVTGEFNGGGGYLQGGKKVYLQVSLDDVEVADDTVKRNITALNSHDGSTSIGFGSSNTVVVCQNTFFMAYKDVKKFWHTANAEMRIKTARENLNQAILLDNELMDNYKRMADAKMDKKVFGNVMARIFDVDLNAKASEISTRKLNKINSFNDVLVRELESHGETLWGLFNAVTFFTNHVEPGEKKNPLDHVMFGGGQEKNLMTYDEIMKFVGSKTTVAI